jgi:hypothetical protein
MQIANARKVNLYLKKVGNSSKKFFAPSPLTHPKKTSSPGDFFPGTKGAFTSQGTHSHPKKCHNTLSLMI